MRVYCYKMNTAFIGTCTQVPKVRWSDVGGLDGVKQGLKEAVQWPHLHPDALTRLGAQPPRGTRIHTLVSAPPIAQSISAKTGITSQRYPHSCPGFGSVKVLQDPIRALLACSYHLGPVLRVCCQRIQFSCTGIVLAAVCMAMVTRPVSMLLMQRPECRSH